MLQEHKKQVNLFIGIGILLDIGAFFMDDAIGLIARLAARAFLIVGCVHYAKAKGHHGAWGALGLLSILGLIVLVCMTDKHKNG